LSALACVKVQTALSTSRQLYGTIQSHFELRLSHKQISPSQRFKTYKQRKLEEGKLWSIVRNNLINKLIKIICAIWNSDQPYVPDHESRFDQ